MSVDLPELDRRAAMTWVAAVAAALGNGASPAAAPATARGYGLDPRLIDAVTPWPRTLTPAQLDAVAAYCDHLLPADGEAPSATAVGVHRLIDEWVSAPYPEMIADRESILAGLDAIEAQARARQVARFAAADPATRAAILDTVVATDTTGFAARLRAIVIGAYYTTEAGFEDIGYIGNRALGAYPPASPEVRAAIDAACATLGLPADAKPAGRPIST